MEYNQEAQICSPVPQLLPYLSYSHQRTASQTIKLNVEGDINQNCWLDAKTNANVSGTVDNGSKMERYICLAHTVPSFLNFSSSIVSPSVSRPLNESLLKTKICNNYFFFNISVISVPYSVSISHFIDIAFLKASDQSSRTFFSQI